MTYRTDPKRGAVIIKHGGGINTRATEDEINPLECSDGKNFTLDLDNHEFVNRKPFDLIGTAPNAGEIRGFISLLKSDGTVKMLVQAGNTVYDWDGLSTFTYVGGVSANAKLRGRLEHNWQLDDKVIITDLNLQQPIMEYDGTTLQNVTFYDSDGTTPFGAFRAKYCSVINERAIFSNVHDNGTNYPHLIVGSQQADFSIISNSLKPADATSAADPFYLIQPDYRVINGMVGSFGLIVTSSTEGDLFKITGYDASDYEINPFFPRSGVSGNESLVYIGDDVLYGRQGRIESLIRTDKFGDVETDDLSRKLFDTIENYKNWTNVYNQREQVVYCFPGDQSEVWVLNKSLKDSDLSPWSKWTTDHPIAFQPTAVMNCLDPEDGLEYVFFGDASGNIYRMEGTGSNGDGGSYDIEVSRTSGLVSSEIDEEFHNIEGWVKYRSNEAITLTIELIYSGIRLYTKQISLTIPAESSRSVYGGGYYYGGGSYYGSLAGRIVRQKFSLPGQSSDFQVKTTVDGTADFNIIEIGLKFKNSS